MTLNQSLKKYRQTKMCVPTMVYIKKICPVCGKEFFVLRNAEEKAVYCTLACLARDQDSFEFRGRAFSGFS